MPIHLLRGAAFALALSVCSIVRAQTVTTSHDEEPLRLASPAPLLTFVSPDASFVARPDETKSAAPEAELAASPQPAHITLETARETTAPPETTFRADTRNIVIRWHGENMRVGAMVRVAWVAEDVGEIVEPGFVIDQFPTEVETSKFGAHFTLSRPRDGWAAGKYRVDLFVDDELKDTLGVTIRD
ncbi:MAG TPA: hypothetical protein VGC85_02780 [Chthoniobacterales bacterium]